MKLLLDENLPHQLRHESPGHDVYTVAFMGWNGIENGELLALAATDGFDALLTKDTKLPFERSASTIPVSIVVLRCASNDIDDVRPLLPSLLEVLRNLVPKSVAIVG